MKAAVIGTGSWGTTFAAVMADAGTRVEMWGRDQAVVDEISLTHRNDRYLPGVRLPVHIAASTQLDQVLDGAGLVAIAVPSQLARQILRPVGDLFPDNGVALSLMKGVELSTGARMSSVIEQSLDLPPERVAVLSGPNLSDEIARRQATATVIAARDEAVARQIAYACATEYFRPFTTNDIVGVELCGAVKNVIALAAGIAQGVGQGHNTMATLITRGLAEITRLGLRLGAEPETFAGLAGTGDLIATCSAPTSRNHSFGLRIGRGESVEAATKASNGVAEGVGTCRSVSQLAAELGVSMPITSAVDSVIHEGMSPLRMISSLITRPVRSERRGTGY